jgi:hypothetical protein
VNILKEILDFIFFVMLGLMETIQEYLKEIIDFIFMGIGAAVLIACAALAISFIVGVIFNLWGKKK